MNANDPNPDASGSGGFLRWLARARSFRRLFPGPVKRLVRQFLPTYAYQRELWKADPKLAGVESESTYPAQVDVRLGIVKEFTGGHFDYVRACRDMGVPYKLIDIYGPDLIEVIRDSGCDAFLVVPRIHTQAWRLMYDERLRTMAEDLGVIIFPSYQEIYLYESKRRMHHWLKFHGVPHPRTSVFFTYGRAMAFAQKAELPIVAKSNAGWGAAGVRILRKRSDLLKHVRRCFRRGLTTRSGNLPDIEWGGVILQEYLPDAREWRIIRLGKYFFGHQKLKKGDFHSGSGKVGWYDPPRDLLDLAYELTEKGRFLSMNMDVFETPDGRYLVNELQSLFGAHLPYQMKVNGRPGRYVRDPSTGTWRFEEGVFCHNRCHNLRVEALLAMLGRDHRWEGTRNVAHGGANED